MIKERQIPQRLSKLRKYILFQICLYNIVILIGYGTNSHKQNDCVYSFGFLKTEPFTLYLFTKVKQNGYLCPVILSGLYVHDIYMCVQYASVFTNYI